MRPEFIQTLRLKYLHVNWYHYYGSPVEREWLQMNWYHYYRSSVEREWLQMNWYHYYGSSVEREWLRMNMNVFSVQRMRGCVIFSFPHGEIQNKSLQVMSWISQKPFLEKKQVNWKILKLNKKNSKLIIM